MKAVVLPSARRADGTWNVKIRVTYNRQSRWLGTPLFVTASQLTRGHNIKDATAVQNAERYVAQVREALAKMPPFWLEGRTVDDAVRWIRRELTEPSFRLDFIQFGREVAQGKQGSTRKAYTVALNNFCRFLGRTTCDIGEVSTALLREFADWCPAGSAAAYIGKLRYIYEQAKARYNDEDAGVVRIPRNPFRGVVVPSAIHRGQRSLGVEVMQRLIDARTDDARERMALDWFVLSFALMGINYIDLYEAAPPKDGVLRYNRRKTAGRRADKAEMRVTVPACLEPFVARQRAGKGPYWLRAPRGAWEHKLAREINDGLKAWARREGVPEFTYYAARHTWATVARSSEAGVPYPVIEDCLNHKADGLLDIYAERDWRTLDEANARVLALFSWPTE